MGHVVIECLVLKEISQPFSKAAVPSFIATRNVSPRPHQRLCGHFPLPATLIGVWWYLTGVWGLNVQFPRFPSNVEDLFICSFTMCISCLVKCLLLSFAHVLTSFL